MADEVVDKIELSEHTVVIKETEDQIRVLINPKDGLPLAYLLGFNALYFDKKRKKNV